MQTLASQADDIKNLLKNNQTLISFNPLLKSSLL